MKFLGSGSAFVLAKENFQSNIAITINDKILLFDCGNTINEALDYNDIKLEDVDSIYLSHNHGDHNGGLEYVGFSTYFSPLPKPKLIGNSEVLDILWNRSLSGGMLSIQNNRTTLETYFDTSYIEPNGSFDFEDVKFNLVQTYHIQDDRRIIPNYGLTFEHNDKKVFITGDCQFNGQLISFYDDADIIFHDCELSEYPGAVHAQYKDLKTLDVLTKRKMYLYHYNLLDKSFKEMEAIVLTDGFAGLVERGQEFIV